MFCRKCGFKNDDDAVFCGRCGERMEEEEPQEELRFPQPSLKEAHSSDVVQQEEVYQEEAPVPSLQSMRRDAFQEDPAPLRRDAFQEDPAPLRQDAFQEEDAPVKEKKKFPILLLIIPLFLILLLLGAGGIWAYLNIFQKTSVPLDGYLKVEFTGPSGYAKAEAEIDWEALEKDYGKKLSFTKLAKEEGIARKYDSPVAYLEDTIFPPSLDKEEGIENGEQIAYQWSVDDKEISSYVNCKLKYNDKKVKAHTDGKTEEEDIFRKMEIKAEGSNGKGYVTLKSLPEKLQEEDFKIEPNQDLKNGDNVKISLKEDPSYYFEKCGILPAKKTMTYQVSGLTEESIAESQSPFATPTESVAESESQVAETPAVPIAPTAPVPVTPPSGQDRLQAMDAEYLCSYSASRLITKQDMDVLMAQYPSSIFPGQRTVAQMIVNEMYARHGYQFKDQELTNYFERRSWYSSITYRNPQMDSIYPQMSEIEKKNVDFLKTYH